jgi:hypothetical protein
VKREKLKFEIQNYKSQINSKLQFSKSKPFLDFGHWDLFGI